MTRDDNADCMDAYSDSRKDNLVYSNDWRSLEPADIGKGVFEDTVTLVLPCYMGQNELALTFASLSKQTYPHHLLEVIVVDDGSNPPIKIPAELPFEAFVLKQERDGFGLARARNLGAETARGEILIFLDCDMIPEPQLVEAHARWHHINDFSLTLGFRFHADFSSFSPDDLLNSVEPRSLLSGKRVTSPQWIEFHMRRTKNLTSDDSDLFRIATGGNLGIRKSFFQEIGGFDGSFKQWGGEDIEFGFRAFNSGAILVPERLATAWHQGEGAAPDPNEEISLEQQRHLLSHLIAEKTFRASSPGRSFHVPMLTVLVDAEGQTFEEVAAQVNSVLSSKFHDLIVALKVPKLHSDKINIERQYGLDSRVQISEDILNEIPNAAFRLKLPARICLTTDAIDYLIKSVDNSGLSRVYVERFGEVYMARTRALKRALRTGEQNSWEGANTSFKENVIEETNFSSYVSNSKNFAPLVATINPPVWVLAGKIFKRLLTIRNPRNVISFIAWLIRGFVNVLRRAKLPSISHSISNRQYAQSESVDWLRISGNSSFFPGIKKWNGKQNGVEVVLVTPGKEGDSEIKEGVASVVLGEATGIPLCPPLDLRKYNPIGFSPVKRNAVIAEFSDLKKASDRIKKARSNLALTVEKIDSPDIAMKTVEYLTAGIPVLLKDQSGAVDWLGKDLVEILGNVRPEKLVDETERERVSVLLRRAAMKNHSLNARLQQVREKAGMVIFKEPLISVVVATKRPEMVDRIIEIVELQDYPNLELVLALHGKSFENSPVTSLHDGINKTVLHFPEEVIFGKVLSEASVAASGEWISKMDDDDWYGTEHISDLLLAARYSRADLVGKGSEFVYLEGRDLTIRRNLGNSEVASRTLAGGTLLIRSDLLREVSGWRELTSGVDVALIDDAVSAGAALWRTHPFGYLLRRTPDGHTWNAKDNYFLSNSSQEWKGKAYDLVGVMKEKEYKA